MRIIPALRNGLQALYASIHRFPVTLALSTLTVIIVIWISEIDSTAQQTTIDLLIRIAMVLALGIPVSLIIKLWSEKNERYRISSHLLVYVGGAILLALYFFFILLQLEWVDIARYISVTMALYVAFLFVPYLGKRSHFERYIILLSARFFVTVLYSAVLFLGIAAILFTIHHLLSVPVPSIAYFYVWTILAGVFAPAFFLAGIPAQDQALEHLDYPKLLKILLLNIVMPLISIYTIILYIYFAKILITLEWPVGLVSHLVLWYSIISIAVILYITPLRQENQWVRSFISWFSKLVLPMLLMMFVSMGIRIQAYGITENRYFVIVMGVWIFAVMLYIAFIKRPRNVLILMTLSCIAFLAVFGPWSAFSISKWSQNLRLEHILQKYDMISEGTIVKSATPVADVDQREVTEILYYFSGRHSLNNVKYLPDRFEINEMENVFGFPPYRYSYNGGEEYFSYYTERTGEPMLIRGFDYLFEFQTYGEQGTSIVRSDGFEIRYENQVGQLQIWSRDKMIYETSLVEFVKQLPGREKGVLLPEQATFEDENEYVHIRFVLQTVNGSRNPNTDRFRIDGLSLNLLVKIK